MNRKSGRGRGAAAIVASMALMGAGAAMTTAPAQSAPPGGDCKEFYPVADLVDDMPVTGLTVSDGTEPEGFTGEYLGKINNGIGPGLDMLMVRLTSPEINRVGIWAGMSGSPVYAQDGRLIGAVAYGLAAVERGENGAVAGVTPYEAMDDYMPATTASPARIAVNDRAARAIAEDSDVTVQQAEDGFRRLPMPVSVNGLSQQRLSQVRADGPDYIHTRGVRSARMGGASGSVAAGPEDLVAGGNLGAALSYGDVTYGGVGTVTSVCGDHLIGFGHPFTFAGNTTVGMTPAETIYVQGDESWVSFKVANLGLPAGTIDQDRLTGISGPIGAGPDETDILSTIGYGARNRTGESSSLSRDWNADITFAHLLANHDVVLGAWQGGSETASYAITGTTASDEPIDIAFSDRYVSDFDISFESVFDIADAVWVLSRMKGVTINNVTAEADLTDTTDRWRVRKLQQRRGDSWVTLGGRRDAVVRPGGVLRLRAVLANGDASTTVRFSLRVPERTGQHATVEVVGGASFWNRALFRADTPAEVERALENAVRNDQLKATLTIYKRGRNLRVSDVSAPQDLVVNGGKGAEVRFRR